MYHLAGEPLRRALRDRLLGLLASWTATPGEAPATPPPTAIPERATRKLSSTSEEILCPPSSRAPTWDGEPSSAVSCVALGRPGHADGAGRCCNAELTRSSGSSKSTTSPARNRS